MSISAIFFGVSAYDSEALWATRVVLNSGIEIKHKNKQTMNVMRM